VDGPGFDGKVRAGGRPRGPKTRGAPSLTKGEPIPPPPPTIRRTLKSKPSLFVTGITGCDAGGAPPRPGLQPGNGVCRKRYRATSKYIPSRDTLW